MKRNDEQNDNCTDEMNSMILVVGECQSGKTSLIRTTIAEDDSEINGNPDAVTPKKQTDNYDLYQTDVMTFVDFKEPFSDQETPKQIAESLTKRLRCNGGFIDRIWLCLPCDAEISQRDVAILQETGPQVTAILTKSDLMTEDELSKRKEKLAEIIGENRIVTASTTNEMGKLFISLELIEILAESAERAFSALDEEMEDLLKELDEISNETSKQNETKTEGEAKMSEENKENEVNRVLGPNGEPVPIPTSDEETGKQADSFINWAAGRAAAIALMPLPMVDTIPLVANEVYLVHKLAKLYNKDVSEQTVTTLISCAGASIGGQIFASFLPGLKIVVAAGTTYGIGKMVKAYFESGMILGAKELKGIYDKALEEGKKIKWNPINDDKNEPK